jgi:hypothetical protein
MSENERIGGHISIVRTITFVQSVPYNDDYYAGMTVEEAIKYEERLPLHEKLDVFIDELSTVNFDSDGNGTYTERVTYDPE